MLQNAQFILYGALTLALATPLAYGLAKITRLQVIDVLHLLLASGLFCFAQALILFKGDNKFTHLAFPWERLIEGS